MTSKLYETVRADRDASELRWEAAIESDADYTADYRECMAAYDDALDSIEGGDLLAAESALETANYREVDGGDNADAHHALAAVRLALKLAKGE